MGSSVTHQENDIVDECDLKRDIMLSPYHQIHPTCAPTLEMVLKPSLRGGHTVHTYRQRVIVTQVSTNVVYC